VPRFSQELDGAALLHRGPNVYLESSFILTSFLQNSIFSGVGDAGFEPATSAVQRRQDRLPEVSEDCKFRAKLRICASTHFSGFQKIYSGCCTEVTACIRAKSGMIAIGQRATIPQKCHDGSHVCVCYYQG
jgi:hypothetical protein